MSGTQLLHRALAVVNACCLVAGVSAAVMLSGDDRGAGDGPQANAAAGARTGVSPAAVADAAMPLSPSPSTADLPAPGGAGAGASSPANAAQGSTPGSASGSGSSSPVNAPKAGTYHYKTTVDGQVVEHPMVVEDVSRKGRDIAQVFVMEANGSKVRNSIVWSAGQVVLSRSLFDFGPSQGDCDWTPDVTQTVFVAKAGTAWQSDSSCTVTMSGVPIKMARRSSTTLAAIERLDVAGETLDVWRIESTNHLDFNGRVTDSTEKTWFSPKYGLVVRAITTTTTKSGDKTRTIESLSELENLEPK